MYLVVKTIITVIIIVAISEIARRSSFIAGILASIPLTSALAITWLYFDTKEVDTVVNLSNSILLLIPPSLTFFVVLPLALKRLDFIYSFLISIVATVLVYWLYIALLSRFGIRL
ncbi:MAG TPA: DUF3147 family protein [Gammaproteobacteria bacterium]|jgi:uncharacterized membrane protein (GlpM family)|uniref:DUF3147 family protein n=1 Tax=marine metagenome TaxID=408172 RepID=A0A381R4F4_9ZZZZ|nr:DUF3147 family protein [SAR86 cluster bacterium]HHZ85319.1 DUF3147 family protein [Gammaproteobacteria bacterium]HIA44031.1 DUF3147 family protein [Gammaproteobacteria bacterium]HIA96501.1 DUF3147 family protein [Gammaproteobacteria bacterium]HIB74621.1 DUF3147 family protein [Gammaproteobacteria bacterium]|tara:strand:- start:940 stop:1284 length:345 start_codon:yes stop_codon:yes gene_type:complete